MATITDGSGTILSFARYEDVKAMDSRVFDSNEMGTEAETEELVNDMLIRSTSRVMSLVKNSTFWLKYTSTISTTAGPGTVVPTPSISKIKRLEDFEELVVYHTLYQYLLPRFADMGDEVSNEVAKIAFYKDAFNELWDVLQTNGDFYDDDGSGTVDNDEVLLSVMPVRRSRGYRRIVGG